MTFKVPQQFLQEQQYEAVERRLTRIETRLCQLMLHLGANEAVHTDRRSQDDERIPNQANPLNTRMGNTGGWK